MKQKRGIGYYQKLTKDIFVRQFILELKNKGVSNKDIEKIGQEKYGVQLKRSTIQSIKEAEIKCKSSQFIKQATSYLLQQDQIKEQSPKSIRKKIKDLVKCGHIPYPFSYTSYRLIKIIIQNIKNQEPQQTTQYVKCLAQQQVLQLQAQQQQTLYQQLQNREQNVQVIDENSYFNFLNMGLDEEIQQYSYYGYQIEFKENDNIQDVLEKFT